jgi:hypothetical protein
VFVLKDLPDWFTGFGAGFIRVEESTTGAAGESSDGGTETAGEDTGVVGPGNCVFRGETRGCVTG